MEPTQRQREHPTFKSTRTQSIPHAHLSRIFTGGRIVFVERVWYLVVHGHDETLLAAVGVAHENAKYFAHSWWFNEVNERSAIYFYINIYFVSKNYICSYHANIKLIIYSVLFVHR